MCATVANEPTRATFGPDLEPAPVERTVDASAGQRLLWLLDHYRGREGRVNVPLGWRITEPLDERALAVALDELAVRHEALRTTYAARGRRLVQRVHAPRSFALSAEPAPVESATEPLDAALAGLRALARRNLDATRSPAQAALWRLGAADHLLLLNIHHLATDFVSGAVMGRDLEALYERHAGLADRELPPVRWQYADWSRWQQETFAAGRLQELQEFWREQLAGAQLPLLAADPATWACVPAEGEPRVAPAPPAGERLVPGVVVEAEPGTVQLDFPDETISALQSASRSLRSTLFPVMLAAFFASLHRLGGQRELAVASLFTNRRPEVRDTVGFFVNMVALRASVDPGAPFATLARSARATVVRALGHCELPIQMLPAGALPQASEGSARVDDVVFQYLEATEEPREAARLRPIDVAVPSGRFALELVVRGGEQAMLRFDPDRFDVRWAAAFLGSYGRLLATAAAAPERPLGELLAATAASPASPS